MTGSGGIAVQRIVCRATVCRGIYGFESTETRREAWYQVSTSLGEHGFAHKERHVGAGGKPPQTQDRFYVIKLTNYLKPQR